MTNTKRILVVDDDAEMRSLLSDFLNAQGYQVKTVESACAALPFLFPSHSQAPDLLISDVQMAEMSGFELARRVSTHRPELPILLISSASDGERQQQAKANGARHFLPKPFRLTDLARLIRQTLSETR